MTDAAIVTWTDDVLCGCVFGRYDLTEAAEFDGCGQWMPWLESYRCLKCGRWYHRACLVTHVGQCAGAGATS